MHHTKDTKTMADAWSAEASPFLQLTVGNVVTASALWLLLDLADGNALRRTHSLVCNAVKSVPWHWARATVASTAIGLRRFASAYPAATCAVRLIITQNTNSAHELVAALPPTVAHIVLHESTRDLRARSRTTVVINAVIAALPPRIRTLELEYCSLQMQTQTLSLAHLSALTTLSCTCSGIEDDTLASLPRTVCVLNLECCCRVSVAASFAHLPALAVLDGWTTDISNASLATLSQTLRELDITHCLCVTNAASFAHLRALATLRCAFTRIGDAAIATIPPSVTELTVAHCALLTPAVSFEHLPALTMLYAANTAVSDTALASLPPSVRELDIEHNTARTIIASLTHLPALAVFKCGGTHISSVAVASLPPSLRVLCVGGCYAPTPTASLRHLLALTMVTCSDMTAAARSRLLDTLHDPARGYRVDTGTSTTWRRAW